MTAPLSRVGVAFPVGATHPTPDVETWLDERTEAELQPPCDAVWTQTGEPCPNPAVWIAYIRCPVHGPKVSLYCDLSLAKCRAGQMLCRRCAPDRVVRVLDHAVPL